jgi:hypothetical protein
MSIKTGMIYSIVGLGISGSVGCGLIKYFKKNLVVEDKNCGTIVLNNNTDKLVKLANLFVIGSGIYGFYRGYYKKCLYQ